MSQLNKESIKVLKQLCRIDCTEEEELKLLSDLGKILDYFTMLEEIDTDGVAPLNHVLEDINNIMRDDEIHDVLPRETFLANAPAHTGGMIKVPPVIKGK